MRAVIVWLALVQLAISFVYILAGEATINAFLTNDDTYYYLQTAWNARHLGFVTFDGINPTNGVQFLWFTILYGLAFLASDKSMFLAVASAAAIVLTCVPYLVIWRLPRQGSNSRQTYLSVFMALVWFLICAYRPNRYLTGLESPLHAAMIWTIVLQYVRIRRLLALGALASSSVLFFVVLLVLNTWTRLDSFGLSASFLILLLLTIDGPLHPTHPTTSLRRSLPVGTLRRWRCSDCGGSGCAVRVLSTLGRQPDAGERSREGVSGRPLQPRRFLQLVARALSTEDSRRQPAEHSGHCGDVCLILEARAHAGRCR